MYSNTDTTGKGVIQDKAESVEEDGEKVIGLGWCDQIHVSRPRCREHHGPMARHILATGVKTCYVA